MKTRVALIAALFASIFVVFNTWVSGNLLALAGKKPAIAPVTTKAVAEKDGQAMEFESFQLVLLKRAIASPGATPLSEAALEALQKEHLAHLGKMAESGKMVIAGPFGDQPDESMRGMCLYRVGSVDEAKKLAEADPMVKAGRLKVEAMTWYVEKGTMTFPKTPSAPAK